ncbi:hypothetical protein B0F90DRAFT_1666870 [Multifurca ochricompacta]|uniref:PH domain-containing protein n=1 Tax=Multifurca ochricompacta TaxID=376703 RepID=A0AAD4QNU5_9AGAM|nr:hypothetical protein B0F90DRAFT_1666870 [Multifurca ochricompacta]
MHWPRVSRRRTGGSEPPRPSSSSSSDTPQDDPTLKPPQFHDPGLARLFSDADLFGQILTSCPDLTKSGLIVEDSQPVHASLNGFSQLVAPDLDDSERAVSQKLAQLSVSNWNPAGDNTLTNDGEVDESDECASDDEHERASPSSGAILKEAGIWGSRPLGEEKLLLETDATLFQDVVILGVVHLTTHRLTFHASLLSSQPNYQQSVLKSGPVVVHRKGLHRKKRVWLQLSHDMISTYPSSRDEDKIKPLRSILLSSIKDIKPVDSKRSRHFALSFDSSTGIVESTVEFDTDESAQDWRRELLGALFLYRRNRRSVLMQNDADDLNAVRINIPLNRVDTIEKTSMLSFAGLISLSFDPKSANGISNDMPLEQVTSIEERKEEAPPSTLHQTSTCFSLAFCTSNSSEDSDSHLSNLVKSVSLTLGLDTSKEIWIKKAHVHRFVVSYYGHLAVNTECVGFWSKSITGGDIRYRVPLSRVKAVKPHDRGRARDHSLVLEIQGQQDLRLGFSTDKQRDEAVDQINRFIAHESNADVHPRAAFACPVDRAEAALAACTEVHSSQGDQSSRGVLLSIPSKHFVCLTIGSRGDVQPYIALGRGLQKEGHKVTIVTHEEYKEWVTGFGLEHRTAGGDPGALMKLSVENKMFSPQFFKESLSNFRTWLDDLLVDSWEQCKDADVLLESPSAMAGVHIAEALHIPYFRTFTMPWTKTKEFPHAFLGPPVESPTFNAASSFPVMCSSTTSYGPRLRPKSTSGAVVPKPLDWGDATVVSGYWFLDNPELGWTPPQTLVDWMAKARTDDKPIVYIGFGSITVPNPKLVTERIIRGVLKLDKVPHDWLFPQIDAALHHGGAGTTGASLRAGIPTLIRPWFGDQFFWASRVQKLGAGIKLHSLHSKEVSHALKKATTDRVMKERAAIVGERIREEDGVRTAISTIYTYLPRAGRDRKTIQH